MSNTTIQVPTNVVAAGEFLGRNLVAIIGVLAVALLASIVVEVIKRRYNAKREDTEQLAKKTVAHLLTLFTTIFTGLGYFIFLAQSNTPFLSQLPYVGQGVTEALGVAYLLYNVRLNKSYQTFANWASKWTKSSPSSLDLAQPAQVVPVAAADELA